jgi:hypothetical protein
MDKEYRAKIDLPQFPRSAVKNITGSIATSGDEPCFRRCLKFPFGVSIF